jgi:hypothetical protein
VRGGNLALDAAAAFETVHDGHHDVADNQVGDVFGSLADTFGSVGGGDYAVVGVEEGGEEGQDVGVVVDGEEERKVGRVGGFGGRDAVRDGGRATTCGPSAPGVLGR